VSVYAQNATAQVVQLAGHAISVAAAVGHWFLIRSHAVLASQYSEATLQR